MNRRSFISKLIAVAVSAPFIGKLLKKKRPDGTRVTHGLNAIEFRGGTVKQRPGSKRLFTIPSEAGEFLGMTMFNGCMVMAMENGTWVSNAPFNSCHKLSA